VTAAPKKATGGVTPVANDYQKKHSRDIFVTKLQQSPAFAGCYTCG